jgi:TrmH family RNA methyltransferase
MIRIYTRNAAWQKLEVLKTNRQKRYRYQQFFVEGVRNLNEAVKHGWQIDALIYSFETDLSDWAKNMIRTVRTQENIEVTAELMAELSGKTDTSELCAMVHMRDDAASASSLPSPRQTCPLAVIFDRPSNKGNLGTLIRSCDALGVDALALTGHAVDPYDPETLAASMGSFFKVPFVRLTDNGSIDQWIELWQQAAGSIQVIGTTAHQARPLYEIDLTQPTILVIGNETEGMSRWFQERCDHLATIPMAADRSASSLNVACAATVLLYEVNRQRSV